MSLFRAIIIFGLVGIIASVVSDGEVTGIAAGLAGGICAGSLVFYWNQQIERRFATLRQLASSSDAGESETIEELVQRLSEARRLVKVNLKREQSRAQAILNSLGEAVLALDETGHVELANSLAKELFDNQELEGRALVEVSRNPEIIGAVEKALDGETISSEIVIDPGNKKISLLAARKSDGGCVLVMRDVTAVRHLERMRRDFVANVSHELRTPISVIRANAETLVDAPDIGPDMTQKLLAATLRNAERLSNLISDLLDLSRLESGRLKIEPKIVSVDQMVSRVAELLSKPAEKKDITIESEHSGLRVFADPQSVEQILYNYVDNAIKYAPENSRVQVSAIKEGELVKITVSDRGPGIPPKHRPRIFERFYRVDPGRSKGLGGTGLGLAICKHLAEANRGKVSFEPTPGGGSTFVVEFPFAETS